MSPTATISMRLPSAMGIALLLALAPGTAAASTRWSDSFPPKVVATYLDADGQAVMVTSAGGAEARWAASALTDALRASGRARLVTDGQSLGDVEDLGDPDIVAKASVSPVDVVAVVRVFPSGPGKPPSAVVTFYSRQSGDALAALSAEKGSPVAPRQGSNAVPTSAMESVSQVAQNDAPANGGVQGGVVEGGLGLRGTGDDDNPVLIQRGIWSSDNILISQYGTVVGGWKTFYRGKHGAPFDDEGDLFDYLGQPGYASYYRSHHLARIITITGGSVLTITGAVLAPVFLLSPGPCEVVVYQGSCQMNAVNPLVWVGVAAAGVGLVALVVGLVIPQDPISDNELYGLVDGYNDTLRKGTPATGAASPPAPQGSLTEPSPKLHLALSGFSTRGGGGLGLRLDF